MRIIRIYCRNKLPLIIDIDFDVGQFLIITIKMDCCCPANNHFDAFVSPLHNTRTTTTKQKFSFRTTPSGSQRQSRVSHTSYNHPQLSQQLQKLESQYQLLKEQERVINQFQINRLIPLEQEVKFYQREIIDRSRQIQELNSLLRIRLEERRMMAGQQMAQPILVQPHAKELTVTNNNETINQTVPVSSN